MRFLLAFLALGSACTADTISVQEFVTPSGDKVKITIEVNGESCKPKCCPGKCECPKGKKVWYSVPATRSGIVPQLRESCPKCDCQKTGKCTCPKGKCDCPKCHSPKKPRVLARPPVRYPVSACTSVVVPQFRGSSR